MSMLPYPLWSDVTNPEPRVPDARRLFTQRRPEPQGGKVG